MIPKGYLGREECTGQRNSCPNPSVLAYWLPVTVVSIRHLVWKKLGCPGLWTCRGGGECPSADGHTSADPTQDYNPLLVLFFNSVCLLLLAMASFSCLLLAREWVPFLETELDLSGG